MTTVIVPAHNEARVIGRLLRALLADAKPGEFDVIVACNGCSDDTATVAAAYRDVRVINLAESSKHLAIVAADEVACEFPRLYVDADVELTTTAARTLVSSLAQDGVLAVAPRREIRLDGSSWPVRAYYRVWSRLSVIEDGLFGRGVLAVNVEGFSRIADRPQVTGDDLYLHSRFDDAERRIVEDAVSVIRGPRTVSDLIRRRIRAAQGNTELAEQSDGRTVSTTSSAKDLLHLVRTQPALWPSIAAFVAITITARIRARMMRRTGAPITWLRDESSRSSGTEDF